MKDFELLQAERKVILSPNLLEKMKYLIKKESFMSSATLKVLEKNEIKSNNFFSIYDEVWRHVVISAEVHLESNINNAFDEYLYEIIQNLSKKMVEFEIDDDYSNIVDKVNLMYDLRKTEEKMYLLRDLGIAKNDCIINMKYFMDEKTIEDFKKLYDVALNEQDIPKLKELLSNAQNLILQEWEKFIQDTDNMTDDNFCFIGHSTSFTKYDQEFYTRYVSCSLYDQDINDTYHGRYGFIFAPQNIVGANSKDMMVVNNAEDKDHLLSYSSIPIIHHPKRLLEETKKQKEENIRNNENRPVYNEVVIDGFNPVGIFCFTDGLKSFDYNYSQALKLKNNFPDLKIKIFNTYKNFKDMDSIKKRVEIIRNLENRIFNNSFKIDLQDISMFDCFFEEFEKLMQSNNYNESDIERIYRYNKKLLIPFDKEPEELFSGQYNDYEIKYILGKNIKYEFEKYLSGNVTAYSFEIFLKLGNYKQKIEKYYPGFEQCYNILSKIDINDEIIQVVNNAKPNSFIELSNILEKVFVNTFKERENSLLEEIQILTTKYNNLYNEKQNREKYKEQYEYFNKIKFDMSIWLAKTDYEDASYYLNSRNEELNMYLVKKDDIQKKIDSLNEKIENGKINNDEEYRKLINESKELNNQKQILSKHKIINRKKIKELNKKISYNSNLIDSIIIRHKNELNIEISIAKFELESNELYIKKIMEDIEKDKKKLEDTKKNFIDVTGCQTLEELEDIKLKASKFLENYEYGNDYILIKLNEELEQLKSIIDEKQSYVDDMREYASKNTK